MIIVSLFLYAYSHRPFLLFKSIYIYTHCDSNSPVSSTDLMILDLASHYTEGVVARVVVNVDSAEACRATGWDPLLIGIVIHHDSSSRLADALFTAGTRDIEKFILPF